MTSPITKGSVAAAVMLAACMPILPLVAAGTGAGTQLANAASSNQLNVDALPAHARGWATWLIAAGHRCTQITAPLLAAQIEQESGWNPDAVAHNPASAGGDARGLAQFQDGTWATWGTDADANGVNSPFDPPDAITAQGRLMCDLAGWAQRNVDTGHLTGDVIDLALAAYFCGRGCILAAGGVPAGGLAHDYPPQVRSRVAKYSLGPVVTGGWTRPLPTHSYVVGSGYGPRGGRLHAGVDLMVRTGTTVFAAADGIVLQAKCDSAYCDRPGNPDLPGCGNMIDIQHAGGLATRYCHLVKIGPGIGKGTRVHAGQLIGWSGSTGHSSGPHLHFEVHLSAPPVDNATSTDPEIFMRSIGLPL